MLWCPEMFWHLRLVLQCSYYCSPPFSIKTTKKPPAWEVVLWSSLSNLPPEAHNTNSQMGLCCAATDNCSCHKLKHIIIFLIRSVNIVNFYLCLFSRGRGKIDIIF